MSLRKLTKIRGSFPNDEVLIKLFELGLCTISQNWMMPLRIGSRLSSNLLFCSRNESKSLRPEEKPPPQQSDTPILPVSDWLICSSSIRKP